MEFELDLNDLRALEKAEAELQRKLSVVQFAITSIKNPNKINPSVLPNSSISGVRDDFAIMDQCLSGASHRFKSSEIYKYVERLSPPITRQVAKTFLRDQVLKERIKILAKGKGRKATIYEKTPLF